MVLLLHHAKLLPTGTESLVASLDDTVLDRLAGVVVEDKSCHRVHPKPMCRTVSNLGLGLERGAAFALHVTTVLIRQM